ncbi:ATP-binding SpoIIE family protein phosphatase [Streptomyces kronopolitis]|uniref:ATP-binding SpoIIE family protein phosphatase n=1 Tax=Streptomyces kronopolitis TaxID=1612435 RepID=UPI00343E463E
MATLHRLVDELRASTAIVYVPSPDGKALIAALVVGHPVSVFTVAEHIAVQSANYTAAKAYRDGRQAFESSPAKRSPQVTMPFPYTVISTPLGGGEGENALGVMTGIWEPPLGSAADLSTAQLRCRKLGDTLSGFLPASRAGDIAELSLNPLFLMPAPDESLSADITFVYHIHKLASALVEAKHIKDVVEVATARIMKPLEAQAMAVCVEEQGRLRLVGCSGYSGELIDALSRTPAADGSAETRVLLYDTPVFLESAEHIAENPLGRFSDGRGACILLPLTGIAQQQGVLLLAFVRARHFRAEERAALVTMATLFSQALERARLSDGEHAMARELQQVLLPHALPHLEQLECAARYLSASESGDVGGDWYDVLTLPDGNVGLVIGDVEGHSSSAAAVMGQICSGVRAYSAEGHRPADLLRRMNQLLTDLKPGRLVTCCCAWVDLATGTTEISSAGHPLPVLRQPDGVTAVPALDVGLPLGVDPDANYKSVEVTLAPETVLALYTDGLVRSHTLDVDAGTRQLLDTLAEASGHGLEDLADRLLRITTDTAIHDDDTALLLARYEGNTEGVPSRVSRLYIQRHDVRGVREVRQFIHEVLREWGLDAISYETGLLATELVTNGLVHADSEVDVRLRKYPDRIRVDVRDSSTRPPVPAPITVDPEIDTFSESGRGLVIVEELATAWGTAPYGRGKSVWFEMAGPVEAR